MRINQKIKTTMPLAAAASFVLAASANAQVILLDDFSTYADGAINGQTGTATGWEATAWAGGGAAAVNGGLLQLAGGNRNSRSLSSGITTGSIFIRANLALGSTFSALELSSTAGNGDNNAVRLRGNNTLDVNVTGGGTGVTVGTSSSNLGSNDGSNHEWLLELNLDTGAGQVWLDGNTAAFDPTTGGAAFTASSGFALNAINVAGAGGSNFVDLDDVQIARSWAEVGVTDINIPEPTSAALLGLSGLALLRRRRK